MTEKYKIYLPEQTKSRLINDAELFEFYKTDGSVNLNAFLKELLVNYFDQYRDRKKELLSTILSDLNEYASISQKDAIALADRIVNTYMPDSKPLSGRSTAITLTVSGSSYDVMRSIENNLLKDISMSQYINELFASYLSISRSEREAIIFKEVFDDLSDAIKKKHVITFSSTTGKGAVFTVAPYMIAPSKEEQCNYLLCADMRTGIPRTFRVARIRAIFSDGEIFTPNEDTKKELQEISIRSPQSASKNIDAKVLFTDRGIEKFHVVTKNRPDVLNREGNIYYFHWPKMQFEEYFKRFGKDAIILSPNECRRSVMAFYKKALEAYNET